MTVKTAEFHSLGSNRPEDLGRSFDQIFSAISSKNLGTNVAILDTRGELHEPAGKYLCDHGFDVYRIRNPEDFCESSPERIWKDFKSVAEQHMLGTVNSNDVSKTRLKQVVMTAMNLAWNCFSDGIIDHVPVELTPYMKAKEAA